mgnify:CR=1 FL=1
MKSFMYNVSLSMLSLFICNDLFFQTILDDDLVANVTMASNETGTDGAIDLQVNGGFAPFEFSWSGPGGFIASTEDISNLMPGEYCVTVKDALCGVATLCVQVDYIVCNEQIILEGLEQAITHPSACNLNNGRIYFQFGGPAGGTDPYELVLYNANGDIVPKHNFGWAWLNLSAGDYTLIVTDANMCMAEFEVELIDDLPQVFLSFLQNTCENASNGELDVIGITNTPGEITYLWSNGSTSDEISNLAVGEYCVTVTNSTTSCSNTACFTVDEIASQGGIANFIAAIDPDTKGGFEDGSILVAFEGGTPPFEYQWTGPNGGPLSGMANSLTGLASGQYCVTLTDLCDNMVSDCFEVPLISAEINLVTIKHTCEGYLIGRIVVEATNVSSGVVFTWSNGSSGPAINNLSAGTYCVTMTSPNSDDIVECYEIQNSITTHEEITNFYGLFDGTLFKPSACIIDVFCGETVVDTKYEPIRIEAAPPVPGTNECFLAAHCGDSQIPFSSSVSSSNGGIAFTDITSDGQSCLLSQVCLFVDFNFDPPLLFLEPTNIGTPIGSGAIQNVAKVIKCVP